MTTMEWIQTHRIIAIVRGLAPAPMEALTGALLAGGIALVEVTFDQANPESWQGTADSIQRIGKCFAGRVLAGAGTVLTQAQLHMAADAGAHYIISPNADEGVIRETRRLGLVSLPGALTPTEIAFAYGAGAHAVKVFPVGGLGAEYIRAVRAPLSHIPLLAVGGINEDNAAAFLAAGCIGLGVGGNLVHKQWIGAGEWEKITRMAAAYTRAAQA